jgi:heme oxygenase (mycobilin-producing)
MTIRVLIEREVEAGQEPRIQQLMTQLRGKAMKIKGYISGETLRDLNNPHKFLVISNWNSVADWKTWEKDPDRLKVQQEMNSLLLGKEKTSVYTHF